MDPTMYMVPLGASGAVILLMVGLYLVSRGKLKNTKLTLEGTATELADYKKKTAHLLQYEVTDSANAESVRILFEADSIRKKNDIECARKR